LYRLFFPCILVLVFDVPECSGFLPYPDCQQVPARPATVEKIATGTEIFIHHIFGGPAFYDKKIQVFFDFT
jgi:hypothetical protein